MNAAGAKRGSAGEWRAPAEAAVVYCYDGSFEGFLCCAFESFARREIPFAVWPPEQETATLYPVREIAADPARAQRVYGGYCRLMGEDGRQLLRRCFLSGEPDKELRLLRFLHVAFAEGPRAMALLGHADVAPVYAMAKAIGSETEKLMGFVRFEEADGMLGAVIHPKNQVLPLLAGHFWSRYPNEKFLIYDAVHQTALLSGGDGRRPEILRLTAPLTLPQADEKERYCQALWKRFYDTLAIETRRNEALRRSHCPKRYWADMTELREER